MRACQTFALYPTDYIIARFFILTLAQALISSMRLLQSDYGVIELYGQCSTTSSDSGRSSQINLHTLLLRQGCVRRREHTSGTKGYYGNRGDSLNHARKWYYIRYIENIYPQ